MPPGGISVSKIYFRLLIF